MPENHNLVNTRNTSKTTRLYSRDTEIDETEPIEIDNDGDGVFEVDAKVGRFNRV